MVDPTGLGGGSLVMNAVPVAAAPGVAMGEVALDLAALRMAGRGLGPLLGIAGRASVFALPFALVGDTPQPPREAYAVGDATLVLEGPKLGKVGDEGTRAYFLVDKPGFFHFGSGREGIDVPVTLEGGQVRFDADAFTAAMGERGLAVPEGLGALGGTSAPDVGALDGPMERRTSSTGNPALSTNPVDARRIVAGTNIPRYQAHHLIPFAVVENDPNLQAAFVKASGTGWAMDSVENLIALPADQLTRDNPATNPEILPMHRGPHPRYDTLVRAKLAPIAATHHSMTPTELRGAIAFIEADLRTLISTQSHPATLNRVK